MYSCPEKHASETPDYCSVCGVEIAGAKPAPAVTAPTAASGAPCPDCATPLETPSQVFCEVCGYNFRTRTPGGVPPVAAKPSPPPPVAAKPNLPPTTPARVPLAPIPQTGAVRWEAVVEVDPRLYGTENLAAPKQQPKQTFTLFERETMIGRAGTEVRVHIPIHQDTGVSRRQALLVRQVDGSLVVRDLGSANGTQVNGTELVAGVDAAVRDGDIIAVGAWTRITFHAALVDAPSGREP